MSYVRPARVDEVRAWLIENFWDSDHEMIIVEPEELAIRLTEKWDLVGYFSTAT